MAENWMQPVVQLCSVGFSRQFGTGRISGGLQVPTDFGAVLLFKAGVKSEVCWAEGIPWSVPGSACLK